MTYHTEWSSALAEELRQPFPPEYHEEKRQGGSRITFVALHHYKRRLNELVGPHGWQSAVRMEPIGGRLVATVALTILGITKENVGDEVEEPEVNERGNIKMVGVPATNSYAQAFKRACADFGLGLYLYDEGEREVAKKPAPARNDAPKLATEAQLNAVAEAMHHPEITDEERGKVQAWLDRGGITEAQAKQTYERLRGWIAEREGTQAAA